MVEAGNIKERSSRFALRIIALYQKLAAVLSFEF